MNDILEKHPERARALIRWVNTKQLPEGYPVDEHFKPPYGPWDQRLCAVPDGDLFRAIREGTADVVTDRIVSFTEQGVLLESGRELAAGPPPSTGSRDMPSRGRPLGAGCFRMSRTVGRTSIVEMG